jgi:hypothetical protein
MMIRTDRLPDATTRGQRRRFAVRSRLVSVSGKTIRHIVIFDNHPDSLRLVRELHIDSGGSILSQYYLLIIASVILGFAVVVAWFT